LKICLERKVRGTFRSDSGADAYFALHSIMDMAHKNKKPQLDALLAIL
jgi:hypothetical protein